MLLRQGDRQDFQQAVGVQVRVGVDDAVVAFVAAGEFLQAGGVDGEFMGKRLQDRCWDGDHGCIITLTSCGLFYLEMGIIDIWEKFISSAEEKFRNLTGNST